MPSVNATGAIRSKTYKRLFNLPTALAACLSGLPLPVDTNIPLKDYSQFHCYFSMNDIDIVQNKNSTYMKRAYFFLFTEIAWTMASDT